VSHVLLYDFMKTLNPESAAPNRSETLKPSKYRRASRRWSLLPVFVLLSILSFGFCGFGQGTAFTYQGRLDDAVGPANGTYDFTFQLFDAPTGGSSQGGPVTNSSIAVTQGLFTAMVDFGPNSFIVGGTHWLEIGARTNNAGTFTVLSPRQQLTPTPFSVFAATAAGISGTISATKLVGTIANSNLPTNAVFSGTVTAGNFNGNGVGVTNLNLALNSQGAIFFSDNILATFSPPVTLTSVNSPRSVALADVNGDGKLDLIAANSGNNTLSVFTNNGSGALIFASSLPVGALPQSVAAADVNSDGKVDLICANFSGNTLTVLTNDGSGGFVLATTLPTSAGPWAVIATDINGDGKVDLITANRTANTITVMTNNGSGGFFVSSSPTVGTAPVAVAAADINNDGRVDLISANLNANTLTVLTNRGSGTFSSAFTLTVDASPLSVVAVDINGDGKPDLISANANASDLSVLTNNGSGFGLLMSLPTTALSPASLVAADINGDGKPDLITANQNLNNNPGTLTVFTNTGGGDIFTPLPLYMLASSPEVGAGPVAIAAGDLNGDGVIDLVSANIAASGGNSLSVLFGTRPAHFVGVGDGLSGLNANNLLSGTLPDARLSFNVPLLKNGKISDSVLSTNVPVLSGGKINDSVLSANVAVLNAAQTFSADKAFSSGSQLFLDPGSASAPGLAFVGDPNMGIYHPASDTIALITGGIERFRVNAAGAVGIGAPIPEAPLHVAEGSAGSISANPNSIAVFERSNHAYVSILTPTTNESGIVFGSPTNANDGGIIYNNSGVTRGLQFRANGNIPKMTIRSDGTVGIGTTTPEAPLAIRGTGAGTAWFDLHDTNDVSQWLINGFGGGLNFAQSFVTDGRLFLSLNGNVGIGTLTPNNKLQVAGGVSATAFVTTSDRNAKENFEPVSTSEILEKVAALPITTWNFKEMPGPRHMGPMAQDFYAAFGLGGSDKTITTVDPDGVALAAIQGLNKKLEQQAATLKQDQQTIAALKARLDQLESRMATPAPQH
jgi:VCBS repeat protein/endosialidase-like protein